MGRLQGLLQNVLGPVIGGAATVMFAMVTAVGIQTLHKTSFDGNHNLLIVAVSLAVGEARSRSTSPTTALREAQCGLRLAACGLRLAALLALGLARLIP
jgi:xanthine/uracil permease